jgi:hypothetical protein
MSVEEQKTTGTQRMNQIVLDITEYMHDQQYKAYRTRYLELDGTPRTVDGVPGLLVSDILPHRQLYISSVKMSYIVSNTAEQDVAPDKDVQISIEFQTQQTKQL